MTSLHASFSLYLPHPTRGIVRMKMIVCIKHVMGPGTQQALIQ